MSIFTKFTYTKYLAIEKYKTFQTVEHLKLTLYHYLLSYTFAYLPETHPLQFH